MKKSLMLLFVFIILTSLNYAQFVRGFGIKVGTTISNQNWDYIASLPDADYNKTGFNAGVFAEFLNVPFISIVTELNYVQKGMNTDLYVSTATNPDGTGEKLEGSFYYFNISALGKLRYNLGIISPYIAAGPKVDFELSRSSLLEKWNDVKKNRIGAKIGIGSEVNLQVVNLLVEFMYDTDFTKLMDANGLKINTHSYDLRVGILF